MIICHLISKYFLRDEVYLNVFVVCSAKIHNYHALNLVVWSFERKTYTWSSRKNSYFWNLADFTWNLADFMKSGRFHVKSTQNLIKSDVSTKTLQFGGCREGAMTQDFMKSWFIAPLLHSSNWIVLVETFAFIRFWVDFTWNPADFMKSKDHLQGIVTLCLLLWVS